jgi:hypothetical protein
VQHNIACRWMGCICVVQAHTLVAVLVVPQAATRQERFSDGRKQHDYASC